MVSVQAFFQDSDFHGARFCIDARLSSIRRVLWAVAIVGSLSLLGYIVTLRVQYYYSYPTSTSQVTDESTIPVPAIAICPTTVYNPNPPDTYSDADIIFLLALADAEVVVADESGARGHFVLEPTALLDNGTYTKCVARFQDTTGQLCQYFIQRLATAAAAPQKVAVHVPSQYPAFLREFGVRLEHVNWCEMKMGAGTADTIDCAPYMRRLDEHGSICIALDNMNGTGPIYFTHNDMVGVINRITINLAFPAVIAMVVLYDPADVISQDSYGLYGGAQFAFTFQNGIYPQLIVQDVRSFESLGFPYGKPCTAARRRSHCMAECIAAESVCDPHFMNLPPHKPVCSPARIGDYIDEAGVKKCGAMCMASCEKSKYSVLINDGFIQQQEPGGNLSMFTSKFAAHVSITQVPLYSPGALLSELGGTIGLFVGASALTMYHLIEFLAIKIWNLSKTLQTGRSWDKQPRKGRVVRCL